MLEEFTDSMKSLNWENIYAKPIEFKSKIEKAQELELELAKSSGERLMEDLDNSKMDNDTVEDIEEEEEDEDGEEEVDDDDEVEVEEEGDESNTLRNIDSENEIADECEGEGSDEDENKHEELVDQGEKNTERGDEEINRNDIFEVESSALGNDLAGFLDDDELYVFPPEVEKLFLQDGNIVIGDDKGVRGSSSSSSSSSNNGLTISLETPRTHMRDIFYQDREVIDLLTPESLSPESLSPKTVPVDTMDDCTEDSNGFE